MAGGTVWATFVALFAAQGAFLFGLDIGYIASILECPSFKRDVGHLQNWSDPQSNIDSASSGFIVSVFSIGCIVAAFPPCSAFFLDSWGRRPSITFGSLCFLVGCVLQATAWSFAQFNIGRFIAGFSIGLLSTVVACYQSEVAPPARRGALTSLYQLMITFGILVANLLDYMLVMRDGGWRIAIAVQALPSLALTIGTYFLPRSPRWLVQNGRNSEASVVLKSLRSSDEEADNELQEIVSSVDAARAEGDPQWSDLLKGRLGGMLLVGAGLQLLQQFCGMNAFMYFGPRIFQQAHMDPIFFQTLSAGVNFLATFPAIFVVDRFGRCPLLRWGAFGMLLSCLAIGAMSGLPLSSMSTSHGMSIVIVSMSFGFVINFAYSWGPVVWVYCAEMFPLKHRGRCMGVTTTANWVGNYFVAQCTPIMLQTIGFGAFFVFGFFCLICFLISLWLPESKGLVLEKVGELFDAKFGLEKIGKTEDAPIVSMDSNKGKFDGYGAAGEASKLRLRA